jgi:UDP-glucuronate decarboxylase
MTKTSLVTGGAGFLGSHLCERLINAGHRVICIDNLQTGTLDNLQSILENSRFQFLEKNICDDIDIEVDEIWNLACPASPKHYQIDPIGTMLTSVVGVHKMLELAKTYRAKILHTSTSEIYGDPLVSPQHESYLGNVNTVGPRSCYDEGKRAAETLLMDYHRQYNVEIKIMRIFNTYGPKMQPHDGRVVSNFIVQALNDQPITVYGSGKQTRSFCYFDDLLDGMEALMSSDSKITGPMNIGNPKEFTITELANLVVDLTGSKSKIVFEKLPEDDPQQRRPDIGFARKELNWEPQVELKQGLNLTIKYFRKLLGNGTI